MKKMKIIKEKKNKMKWRKRGGRDVEWVTEEKDENEQ